MGGKLSDHSSGGRIGGLEHNANGSILGFSPGGDRSHSGRSNVSQGSWRFRALSVCPSAW